MPQLAVETRHLEHRFGRRLALQDLNLSVGTGQILGLFGENGAGKTTTLRVLAGLLHPTGGTVRILGQAVANALPRVGVVLDQPGFYPGFSALENLELMLAYCGRHIDRQELRARLEQVGLAAARGRVGGFSLGMRRRLALALALAKPPEVLLLDEPTGGLDLDGVEWLRALLREEARRGTACVLSTHNWDEAERLVDTVVMLDQGKVVYSGPAADLLAPGEEWLVRCDATGAAAELRNLAGVTLLRASADGEYLIRLDHVPITAVTERLVAAGCVPESVARSRQTLAEAYRGLLRGRAQ